MLYDVIRKFITSRKSFRNYYIKRSYVAQRISKHFYDLCKEYNITEEITLMCSPANRLLYDCNIMREKKGIAPRADEPSKNAYMITMHDCQFPDNKAHNVLIGIIVNMDNIMAIVDDADKPYKVDKYDDILKTFLRHEIGHVTVEGSAYEGMTRQEFEDMHNSLKKEEEKTLAELKKVKDNAEYAECYYHMQKEAKANEAVGITLDEMCAVYSRL